MRERVATDRVARDIEGLMVLVQGAMTARLLRSCRVVYMLESRNWTPAADLRVAVTGLMLAELKQTRSLVDDVLVVERGGREVLRVKVELGPPRSVALVVIRERLGALLRQPAFQRFESVELEVVKAPARERRGNGTG